MTSGFQISLTHILLSKLLMSSVPQLSWHTICSRIHKLLLYADGKEDGKESKAGDSKKSEEAEKPKDKPKEQPKESPKEKSKGDEKPDGGKGTKAELRLDERPPREEQKPKQTNSQAPPAKVIFCAKIAIIVWKTHEATSSKAERNHEVQQKSGLWRIVNGRSAGVQHCTHVRASKIATWIAMHYASCIAK